MGCWKKASPHHWIGSGNTFWIFHAITLLGWSICDNQLSNKWFSSMALDMECAYSILFKRQIDYSSYRVFISLYYPYLQNYMKNKFDNRSLPCVFMEYSFNPKRYQCLHKSMRRIFISRHVVFNENIFPFAQEKNCSNKRQEICLLSAQEQA